MVVFSMAGMIGTGSLLGSSCWALVQVACQPLERPCQGPQTQSRQMRKVSETGSGHATVPRYFLVHQASAFPRCPSLAPRPAWMTQRNVVCPTLDIGVTGKELHVCSDDHARPALLTLPSSAETSQVAELLFSFLILGRNSSFTVHDGGHRDDLVTSPILYLISAVRRSSSPVTRLDSISVTRAAERHHHRST